MAHVAHRHHDGCCSFDSYRQRVRACGDEGAGGQDTQFCPSWAEAHERSLAILNNGRPPFPVRWKGCIVLKRGTTVEIVDHQDYWTEIVVRGKHWFADE